MPAPSEQERQPKHGHARNRRERLFLDAIDRFLARELHARSDTEKKELEKVMDAELEEIWRELDLVEISER